MTNKEDGDNHSGNPRKAAFLAVHLVSQLLDEASEIANAARDSGQPWDYLSMLKSFKSDRRDTVDKNLSFKAPKGDCDVPENKMGVIVNVATSTPAKVPKINCTDEVERPISPNVIGQDDEDLEMQQNELGTSTLINRLFDMSDVEHILPEQTNSITKITPDPDNNALINKAMQQIFGSCMAHQHFNSYNIIQLDSMILPGLNLPNDNAKQNSKTPSPKTDDSDYSFLGDACTADINRDVAFYIDDDTPYIQKDETPSVKNENEKDQSSVEEYNERGDFSQTLDADSQEIQKNVALYEDAYVTLNRDYDQGSEDGYPILQDPKGMVMQEVELMTANTSDDDNIVPYTEIEQKSEKEPVSKKVKETPTVIYAPVGYKRQTLAKRFRVQGARLLSCFKSLWRRTPNEESEINYSGVLGARPLSPDSRRRASSLLDNMSRRSPSLCRGSTELSTKSCSTPVTGRNTPELA